MITTMITTIAQFFSSKNDPVKRCEFYNDDGCSHVDGFLCDFPHCSMNNEYIERKKIYNIQCPVCGYYCLGKGGFGCIDKPTMIVEQKGNHENVYS